MNVINTEKAALARERASLWYKNNRERALANGARRYAKKRREVLAANARWAAENPEKARAISARYRAKHRLEVRARIKLHKVRRRAAAKNLAPFLTQDEHARIKELYARARTLTVITGEEHHVDHIVPLARGGPHHPNNLQILTAAENRHKGAKLPDHVFYRRAT